MGQVVFNSKICDHAEWCPAKTACERLMGVSENKAAIYYNTVTKKITVNGTLCASYDCIEKACTRQCQYFKYAYTDAEKWMLEQDVNEYEEDPNFNFIPRFNAGGCPKHSSIEYDDLIELIKVNRTILFIEITNARSSVGIFEGIKYSDLISDDVYNKYYKKLFIENLTVLQKAEEEFEFYELPIILVFYKNQCIDKISGIYKNNELEKVNELKCRFQNILQHYSNIK